MTNINTYLHFEGQTEEAMTFYKSILGGEFIIFSRFKDTPGGEKMDPADQEKMIHVSLKINDVVTIMATDMLKSMGHEIVAGNNFHICIQAESEKETEKIFNGLSAGGKIEMPLNHTFWGAYFGMLRDKYGIQWMINYETKNKK